MSEPSLLFLPRVRLLERDVVLELVVDGLRLLRRLSLDLLFPLDLRLPLPLDLLERLRLRLRSLEAEGGRLGVTLRTRSSKAAMGPGDLCSSLGGMPPC